MPIMLRNRYVGYWRLAAVEEIVIERVLPVRRHWNR